MLNSSGEVLDRLPKMWLPDVTMLRQRQLLEHSVSSCFKTKLCDNGQKTGQKTTLRYSNVFVPCSIAKTSGHVFVITLGCGGKAICQCRNRTYKSQPWLNPQVHPPARRLQFLTSLLLRHGQTGYPG